MEMLITAICTRPPKASLSPAGATVFADGDLEFYVILPNGTLVSAFILAGNITTSAEVQISMQIVTKSKGFVRWNSALC
jgi:hypothetical protein